MRRKEIVIVAMLMFALDARIHAGMTRLELSENATGADVSDNSIE